MENKTDYTVLSLFFHLTFARLMKEHVFFLENSALPQDRLLAQEAAYHKQKFEKLLAKAVTIGSGMLPQCILKASCIVTKYTLHAERHTAFLTRIPFNTSLTLAEHNLAACGRSGNPCIAAGTAHQIKKMNRYAIRILTGLLQLKERIINQVKNRQTAVCIYPLWIAHTIREARLYRSCMIRMETAYAFAPIPAVQEEWGQIAEEHALLMPAFPHTAGHKYLDMRKTYRDMSIGTEPYTGGFSYTALPLFCDHILREELFYRHILEETAKYT